MRRFENTKIKEEIPEACSSSSTEQQEYNSTHCGHGLVDYTQQMQCGRDVAVNILDKRGAEKKSDEDGMACSVICSENFQSGSAFDDHFDTTHSKVSDIEASQLRTEEQTHINYYDLLPKVKVEIDESELPVERGLSFSELSSVAGSNYEQNTDIIIKTEDCPQLMRSRTITKDEEYASEDIPIKKEKHFDTTAALLIDQYRIDSLPRTEAATSRNKTAEGQNNQCDKKDVTKAQPIEHSFKKRDKLKEKERHTGLNAKIKKKNYLKVHISTSAGEKPFGCNMCAYKCNRKSHLKQHILTHTGEKPFACEVCDYRCTQKSHLNVHMRIHTGEKPFRCNMCAFKGNQKVDLKRHMLTHTREKRFACNVCSHRYVNKSYLIVHMRTHAGQKPFWCNMCAYKCNQKSNLKRHMLTHTIEKPFTCNMCDYKCNRKGNLIQHIRTHTR